MTDFSLDLPFAATHRTTASWPKPDLATGEYSTAKLTFEAVRFRIGIQRVQAVASRPEAEVRVFETNDH